MRLVIDATDRAALEDFDCPHPDCRQPAGLACLRSGGAIVGGSSHRFGEYVHLERWELAIARIPAERQTPFLCRRSPT